ncbi:MAG: hypothetical protein Q4C49_14410 [Bacillota bacterium]|nr:hypothetical protein [Bacillota bacterium]
MQITDSAKSVIEELLAEENKNGVTFFTEGQGCQTRLVMDYIIVSDGPMINGIYVDMSEETARMLENIILDARDGKLVIRSTVQSSGCGGCSGCGSGSDCGCEGGCN